MYMKNGNIYMTNDINNIPINKLKIGEQIIIPRAIENKRADHITYETSIMIFSEKLCDNRVLEFELHDIESRYDTTEEYGDDENEEPKVIEERAWADHNSKYQNYFILPDGKLHFLGESSSYSASIEYSGCINEEENETNKIDKKIYKLLFQEDYFSTLILENNEFFINRWKKDSFIHFYPFKLDEDTYLLFNIESNISPQKRKWNKSKYVSMIKRNGDVYRIKTDFERLLKTVSSFINSYSHEYDSLIRFEKDLKVFNFDVNKYACDLNDRFSIIFEVKNFFNNKYSLKDIETLFSPVYMNLELNLEIFPDTLDYNFRLKPVMYQKSKKLHSWHIRENKDLNNEYRIGSSILLHDLVSSGLVNPYTGEVKDEKQSYFKDYGGIIIYQDSKYKKDNIYFIRLKDYYVPADKDIEKDLIDELKSRSELVDILDKTH